jgi:hypothetical protein
MGELKERSAQSDWSASQPNPEALVFKKERRLNGEGFMNGSRNVEKLFGVDKDVTKVRPEPWVRAARCWRQRVRIGLIIVKLDERLNLFCGGLAA